MCAGPPLKCVNPKEVYLLLKSSDFVTHDLDFPYEGCQDTPDDGISSTQYHLVLKKWFDMPRSHEFRCFVRQRQLIGMALYTKTAAVVCYCYSMHYNLDRRLATR